MHAQAGPAAIGNASLRLAVVESASTGIDPVVGQHVTQQVRSTGVALGYEVLGDASIRLAAGQVEMPYPPSPADLWRVTFAAKAHRGAFAHVWAEHGQYVIELLVASLDGTGPFWARGTSGAHNLHDVVDALVRRALASASEWNESAAQQLREQALARRSSATTSAAAHGSPRQREAPPSTALSLALQTEGAFGTSTDDSFYNHLAGARLDLQIGTSVFFGAYLGYANLRGRNGRVGNLLTYGQIENRIPITSTSRLVIPLRVAVGYLPFNGPVVRLAAGLQVPLTETVRLGFDLLTPTFWVLPDRTAVSLNVAAELSWGLF